MAEPEGGDLVLPARLTHRDIAAMVGASREMVTRVFRTLEEHGVLRIEGRHVTITSVDPDRA